MIVGINHVQVTIPVGKEQDAREFYCKVLGLKELEKPDALKVNGGLWLLLGDLQIHLGTENNPHRDQSKAHIAYEVTDIVYWREKLTSQGISIKENTAIEGWARFDIRDPFGNRIELMQRLPL
ncbi:glyoxalase [Veronia nyctiphanis]|uniref:Glyoxalase n=1 Tax=Veronia nyctiphanis TaxID=1278244 RepID=A0A4Q0YQ64_9GAMM|nr:VOC family protein [Veronia nyctiphanis]RXJ72733.1 glyoxalase [Veronia nyctiphanis]